MMHTPVTRRKLLQWSAVLCCLAFAPRSWRRVAAKDGVEREIARRIAGLFDHPGSAREIGKEYLRLAPSENDVAVLVRKVIPDSGRMESLATVGKESLRRHIATASRKDFQQGRMISVNGWMLSQTELRLCAIVALT